MGDKDGYVKYQGRTFVKLFVRDIPNLTYGGCLLLTFLEQNKEGFEYVYLSNLNLKTCCRRIKDNDVQVSQIYDLLNNLRDLGFIEYIEILSLKGFKMRAAKLIKDLSQYTLVRVVTAREKRKIYTLRKCLKREDVKLKKSVKEVDRVRTNNDNKYHKYLRSYKWIKFRDRLKKERGCCEHCGSKENLECHHKTYKNMYNEKPEDILVLCKKCHTEEHRRLKINKK